MSENNKKVNEKTEPPKKDTLDEKVEGLTVEQKLKDKFK